MRTLCKTSNSLRTVLFLNERGKLWLNRRFLSYVFLCSEFKLENIYRGVNFCGKKYGYFLFKETYFWGLLEKSQKLEPAKISCNSVVFAVEFWQLRRKYRNRRALNKFRDYIILEKKVKNDNNNNNNNRGKRTKTKKNCRWPIYVFFSFLAFYLHYIAKFFSSW